jgi:hypothetical protein
MSYESLYGLKNDQGFEVEVIETSVGYEAPRITTMRLRYPRFIHAELMTHRVFSRNARSSRAVPTERLLTETPFLPQFAQNQKGMQAGQILDAVSLEEANEIWLHSAEQCQKAARELHGYKVHKQWANRMLEWFGWIDVLITSTEWDNFFALRNHPDAQPEFQVLAAMMEEAYSASAGMTTFLNPNEPHLPYINPIEKLSLTPTQQLKISAARCARVSYTPFDGNANIEAEIERFDKLASSVPVHASPLEHQAYPDSLIQIHFGGNNLELWMNADEHRNFVGWRQFRAIWEDQGELLDLRTTA